jgi:hypothetical protein
MPVTAMTPIRIRHTLECFYFGIYMFYHNPPSHKLFVICFFLFSQLMFLLGFTGMKLFA